MVHPCCSVSHTSIVLSMLPFVLIGIVVVSVAVHSGTTVPFSVLCVVLGHNTQQKEKSASQTHGSVVFRVLDKTKTKEEQGIPGKAHIILLISVYILFPVVSLPPCGKTAQLSEEIQHCIRVQCKRVYWLDVDLVLLLI